MSAAPQGRDGAEHARPFTWTDYERIKYLRRVAQESRDCLEVLRLLPGQNEADIAAADTSFYCFSEELKRRETEFFRAHL